MGDRKKMIALAVFAENQSRKFAAQGRGHHRLKQYAAAREMRGREYAYETMTTQIRLALGMSQADLNIEARLLGFKDSGEDRDAERARVRNAIRGQDPVEEVDTERVLGEAQTRAQAPEDERAEDDQRMDIPGGW